MHVPVPDAEHSDDEAAAVAGDPQILGLDAADADGEGGADIAAAQSSPPDANPPLHILNLIWSHVGLEYRRGRLALA